MRSTNRNIAKLSCADFDILIQRKGNRINILRDFFVVYNRCDVIFHSVFLFYFFISPITEERSFCIATAAARAAS